MSGNQPISWGAQTHLSDFLTSPASDNTSYVRCNDLFIHLIMNAVGKRGTILMLPVIAVAEDITL